MSSNELHILETSAVVICKICQKVFKISTWPAHARRNAVRHVRSQHGLGDILDNFAEPADLAIMDAPVQEPALEPVELLKESPIVNEDDKDATSQPEKLFALMYMRFGFSEREAAAILHLLKLNLDFSRIKNARDVLQAVGVASTVERAACRVCNVEGTVDNQDMRCVSDCGSPRLERYVTADLAQQLINVCEGGVLHGHSPATFRAGDRIRDVTDGLRYATLVETFRAQHGAAPEDLVLSLIISTDGVQIFNSSTQSLWPFFATLCELPIRKRFLNEKIVTYAMWQGAGKPPVQAVCANLRAELDKINRDGLFINTAEGRKRAYVTLAGITGDLQARYYYMNMVGVGGEHCCALCEVQGVRVPRGQGSARIYPPTQAFSRRTVASIERDAAKGTPELPANGFCGVPRIQALGTHMDFGTGIFIDAMHGICLGVAKSLTSLMFTGPQKYLTEEKRRTANRRYKEFFPPASLGAKPGSISLAVWKAKHYKQWLLFYSLPCLDGLLSPGQLKHWALLVSAYSIMISSEIQLHDLDRATDCLRQFCLEFQLYYDEGEFGLNFHGLLHLAEMVENWGPLSGYDLFAFESKNGWLMRHSYGNHSVIRSLMRPLLGSQILTKESQKISVPHEVGLMRSVRGERLRDGLSGPGWRTWSAPVRLSGMELPHLEDHLCRSHSLTSVLTATINGVTVWSRRYRRATKTKARYFLATNLQRNRKEFIEVAELVLCRTCQKMLVVHYVLDHDLVEPSMFVLRREQAGARVSEASELDLLECITRDVIHQEDHSGRLQAFLVEKSRYSN